MAVKQQDYTTYWHRTPPPPKTFGIFRAISRRARFHWTPPNQGLYVRNPQVPSEPYYFENVFKELDEPSVKKLLGQREMAESHNNEIRTRLYRAIHHADILDHLMPAESRSYWPGRDRLAKLLICIALSCIAYIAALLAPAMLYHAFFVDEAVYHTYRGPHAALIRDQEFVSELTEKLDGSIRERIEQTRAIARITPQELVALRDLIGKEISKLPPDVLTNLNKDKFWRLSNEEQRKEASVYALFLNAIATSINRIEGYPERYSFVVTPYTNSVELLTQILIVAIVWGLITTFFSRKSEFYSIILSCAPAKRPLAVIAAISFLEGIFRWRKRFHYLIAAIAATVATCVHFYYVSDFDFRVAQPVAQLVGLVPYDYRLVTELRPVFVAHWILQFLLVFTFVLLAWEVGLLGDCARKLQRHIVKKKLYSNVKLANEKFESVNSFQKYALIFGIVAVGLLCFFGFWKVQEAKAVGLVASGGWFDWLTSYSSISRVVYCFSPAIGAAGLMLLALRPMYKSVDEAASVIDAKKKWDEEDDSFWDAALDQFEGKWKDYLRSVT